MTLLERQLALLDKELDLVDSSIRQIDQITTSIKNWAIVTWTAAVGVALATPRLQPFVWLTAAIPLLFWLVDGSYRKVQRSFILRSREIRHLVNSEAFKAAVADGTPLDFELLVMRTKSSDPRELLVSVMLLRTVPSRSSTSGWPA